MLRSACRQASALRGWRRRSVLTAPATQTKTKACARRPLLVLPLGQQRRVALLHEWRHPLGAGRVPHAGDMRSAVTGPDPVKPSSGALFPSSGEGHGGPGEVRSPGRGRCQRPAVSSNSTSCRQRTSAPHASSSARRPSRRASHSRQAASQWAPGLVPIYRRPPK